MSKTHSFDDGTKLVHGSKKKHGNGLDGQQHLVDPFPKRLTAAEKRSSTRLSPSERKEWEKALKTIAKGWEAFVEVGTELKRIRDFRLYREEYNSWEDFCRAVMGCSKTEANRQIIDAQVVSDLMTPNGANAGQEAALPQTRSHARALATLKTAEERREAWQRVVEKSQDEPITARLVEVTVDEGREEKVPKPGVANSSKGAASGTQEPPAATEFDVLQQLQRARLDEDWAGVDAVIEHLKGQAG